MDKNVLHSRTNAPTKVKQVDHKTEPKQDESQEPISLGMQLKGYVPTFLFFLFVVTYLVCAVIRFVHTNYDITMFTTILPYLAVYVGIPMVTPHIPRGNKKGNDQQD